MDEQNGTLTPLKDVAKHFGVNPETLRKAVRERRIQATRIAGSSRIYFSDLQIAKITETVNGDAA